MNYELFATRAEQSLFAFCRDENSDVKKNSFNSENSENSDVKKTRSTPKTPKTPM
jgi:hypothetical protein